MRRTTVDDAPSDDGVWYFAYGSNLCRRVFVETRCMRPRRALRARLPGWRICFDLPVGPGERGVANVVECADGTVYGVAYLLDLADAERLDRTEGVHRGWYRRHPIAAQLDDGVRLGAFTYRSPYGVPGRKPSARYLGLILDGAREHGLPAAWIGWLGALELAVDERLAVNRS